MTTDYDNMPREKRLTPEEMERHIARLTAPRPPTEIRDPFEVCPTRHIESEELAKMTDRLYTQSLQRKAASVAEAEKAMYGNNKGGARNAAGEVVKLSPEEEEMVVTRLYTQSLQRKQANMEQLKAQFLFHPADPAKKVPLDVFVQHMYNDRLEAKKKTAKRLHDLYIVPTEIRTGTITHAQVAESANRLSTTKART
ncbi:hypothetical protein ABB37_05050 [Leptomonas pyrrhocoris]|uniref:Uncharacterized protein n=1 Tax=Leptomonas pyrrhocoris TaxID=157538 RepID=A0A0M9G0P7_LEPPY|nr:hypothetical protein ABB37_05050 [Leptomonas pyrrhocoris]XP_015658469.1 hypothetical protein ABB37_05050 [Leptomonas pyrrhocoris]KPA80029.1 hypothetical protein ABB37_05050 [Leptomonas pyrrhocoris]KPA80030.1 hypothetical protein ABB37_05050 [Leptomonas pyrrhocoris]|eukprot:XP_015658468.1 hypothetical protein ABB37_05050 [Leptomonas pyrrhocoris]